jgi:hypothetical protein
MVDYGYMPEAAPAEGKGAYFQSPQFQLGAQYLANAATHFGNVGMPSNQRIQVQPVDVLGMYMRQAQLAELRDKQLERQRQRSALAQIFGPYSPQAGGVPWRNPGMEPGFVPPNTPLPAGATDISNAPPGTVMTGGALIDRLGLTPTQRNATAIAAMIDPRTTGENLWRFMQPPKAPDIVEAYDKDGRPQKYVWDANKGYVAFGGPKADTDKAPTVHEFFDIQGRPYKAQWDGKDWIPVGGTKDEPAKTRTVHRGDSIFTEEYRGGKWEVIAEAPRFNPNTGGLTVSQRSGDEGIANARRQLDAMLPKYGGSYQKMIEAAWQTDPLSGVLGQKEPHLAYLIQQARQRMARPDPEHQVWLSRFAGVPIPQDFQTGGEFGTSSQPSDPLVPGGGFTFRPDQSPADQFGLPSMSPPGSGASPVAGVSDRPGPTSAGGRETPAVLPMRTDPNDPMKRIPDPRMMKVGKAYRLNDGTIVRWNGTGFDVVQ